MTLMCRSGSSLRARVVNLRNVYRPEEMRRNGFTYFSIGQRSLMRHPLTKILHYMFSRPSSQNPMNWIFSCPFLFS
jgi:hypothetical protein